MEVHNTKIFMRWHPMPSIQGFFRITERVKLKTMVWPGNNPITNLWTYLKDKVAEKQPSNAEALRMAIKEVWVQEIMPEYCEYLVYSMPHHFKQSSKPKEIISNINNYG